MPITDATPPPAGPKRSPAGTRKSASLRAEREEAINGLGQLAQVPLLATKQYADVGALSQHWPNVSRELASLADTQDEIARFIDPLLKVGPYAGMIAAVLPLILQVTVNHGITKPGAMGTVPPTLLAAQIETGLAQAELEALRVQAEAEKAAQQMRNEIDRQRNNLSGEPQESVNLN